MSVRSQLQRCFRFNGLTLRASGNEESDLVWLDEFLTPWFEPVTAADADCEVELIEDHVEYTRWRAAGPRKDGALVHCFWRDHGAIRLPLWCSNGEERVVFDERLRSFYVIGSVPTRVQILTAPDNRNARFALMRVMRELALIHTRASGQLLIHGASVEIDGRAFLIAGPKGAGKTSLLIAFLLEHGARFISNDRVVVRLDAEGPSLRGMPTVVSVRSQTLDAHPVLRSRLARRGYDHRRTLAEIEDARAEPRRTADGAIDLSPAQLCALVGVQPSPEGRLGAMLFPAVGAIDGTAHLFRLDAPNAAARLTAALLAPNVDQTASEGLFDLTPTRPLPRPIADDDTIMGMARMPSFDLRPADGGHDGRRAVADLVRLVAAEESR